MKAILQRVTDAKVEVDSKTVGEIGTGFLILLGVENGDTEKEADALAAKIAGLRIFTDENDKMNLALADVNGSVLVISNFTLCADCKKGRRPSFTEAMRPPFADELYRYFVSCLREAGVQEVKTGEFGAQMEVSILNDGPVTVLLDTNEIMPGRIEK